MMDVEVSILSGRSVKLSLEHTCRVMEVMKLSSEALELHISRLYYGPQALGSWWRLNDLEIPPNAALTLIGVASKLQVISGFEALCTSADAWPLSCGTALDGGAFLAIRPDGGAVVWGGFACTDDFCEHLRDVVEVKSTLGAFAALKPDGSVACWGKAMAGGDKSSVSDQLREVIGLYATSRSFAAVKRDGRVVTWGGPLHANFGGDSSRVATELQDVRSLRSSESAFAAIRDDGSVVTWGNSCEGGDSSRVKDALTNVTSICATRRAFAALRSDGSVITWGMVTEGGGSFWVEDQLRSGVQQLCASETAFAALKTGGDAVVTWGDAKTGGDSSGVQERLRDVEALHANDCAFAALLKDGSVVTWGDASGGGNSNEVQGELHNIVELQAFQGCFAALSADRKAICWGKHGHRVLENIMRVRGTAYGMAALTADGAVVSWGESERTHNIVSFSSVEERLIDVANLHVSAGAFAAVLCDGSVVTWGDRRWTRGFSFGRPWLASVLAGAWSEPTSDEPDRDGTPHGHVTLTIPAARDDLDMAGQQLVATCEEFLSNKPLDSLDGIDPLEDLSPGDKFRVKLAWRQLRQLLWIQQGRLPSAVCAWLNSRGCQTNAGQMALILRRKMESQQAKQASPEKADEPEVKASVFVAAQVLLLRAAAYNDLCLMEAEGAARKKAHADAFEAAKARAPAFQKWCEHKAATRAAAAANALLMAYQSRDLQEAKQPSGPLWMRFSFCCTTEAKVSALPCVFRRRMLQPQEASYGISVWGYVHLEWPTDKEDIFSPHDALVTHLDMTVERPESGEGEAFMSLPSLEGTPPDPVAPQGGPKSLEWWEDHLGCRVACPDPKKAFRLQVGSPHFMVRETHLPAALPALPKQEAAVLSLLPDLKFLTKDEHLHVLWNHAVEADQRLTGTPAPQDPMISHLEDAIRASAWPTRTWILAGVFFAGLADSLKGRSSLSAEQAARRAMLLGICAKLMAKNGRRRDAHARELDFMDSQSDEGEIHVEEVVLPKVSFRNFSVDLSDQPTSPTSVATQALREALSHSPVDLEELSMALEHARRADVDAMLLQRGEEIFMSIIEKQGAVTRLATAIQNRMLKELRAAVRKAEEVQLEPTEYPDAEGRGILQRARDVVKEEELAALEELRSAMGGGAGDPQGAKVMDRMGFRRERRLVGGPKIGRAPRGRFAALGSEELRHLKQLLGPSNVLTPEEVEREDLLRYNQDWMGKWEGRSSAILKPATTQEVSAILKYANEKNLAVVPQGGNTGLVGGSVPVHDELVLSLLRMNQVEALDTLSGIVTVEAGCVLEQLDQYLAKHGFMVPLDLGAKGTCTIGGNAATNAGGLRYLRYGSLRGNVLGVEAVLADGQVVDSLSALRKDNTGYGLPQLFIGSEGTLGVITKLTILCPARPKAVNIAFFACSSFEHVQRTFSLARQKLGEVLSAVEFCDRSAIDFVLKREAGTGVRDPLEETYPFYVLIETSGSDGEHDSEKLHRFLEAAMSDGDAAVQDGVVAADETQARALWRLREGVSDAMTTAGYVYKYDVSLPLPRMYELVEETRQKLQEAGVEATAKAAGYGHLGDANLHLNVTSLTGRDDKVLELLEPWVFEWVSKANGSISAEHGIGQCKPHFLHLSKSESAVALMRTLKATMDPKGILNPYKVLA
ncbi:D-2-hydroxyglutarate dehydrogenase [Durusdinium trenchii]|uniref:Mitochondrial n=1 Tax=Durusdinium trenchii TaxID=1381693 RepID=A0ABP0N6E8_9DINO